MSCALTPADRMKVTEVGVAPHVKLLRPTVVVHLQVNALGYTIQVDGQTDRYTDKLKER